MIEVCYNFQATAALELIRRSRRYFRVKILQFFMQLTDITRVFYLVMLSVITPQVGLASFLPTQASFGTLILCMHFPHLSSCLFRDSVCWE